MDKKKLEQYFCWKLSRELRCFKAGVLQHNKEEIFSMAYQIDVILSLYELLIEMSQKMNAQELQNCIRVPNLLAFLYHGWLQVPDSQMEELEQAIIQQIQELVRKAA